ncbi:MAG: MBL fold metallo-hydrolase [Bacteroidetes bacterium]|nr:MBL fold metallo-hydrolase [Bacteroidota bacterium]
MKKCDFHPVNDVIIINALFTEMFLVRTDRGFIAIDTGCHEAVIKKGLACNNIKPNDVKAVFITHSDIDHQNVVDLFEKAQFYFPKKELEMIEKRIPRFNYFPFIKNWVCPKKYITLNDNDSLSIDNLKVKCISLPGHTLGSMGYIIDDKYLFSGDAFRIINGKITVPKFKLFVMDLNEMKKSIEKVSQLEKVKYIFTSHTGFTADFTFAVSK